MDQFFCRCDRYHRRALINTAVAEVPRHTLDHAVDHPFCLEALVRIPVHCIRLKCRFKLRNDCIFIKIRNLVQLLLHFPVTVQLIVSPCDIRIPGDLAQCVQIIFTERGHKYLVALFIACEPQHLLPQPLEGMGIRRAVIIVRLIPVHRVKRLKSIASVCSRACLFRIRRRIADGNPVIPQIFHAVEIHCVNLFCRKFLVGSSHRSIAARGMFRLYGHRRLLLRSQFKKSLSRQIIQHIPGIKHLFIIAVDFLCRIDPLITEIVRHFRSAIHIFCDIEYHDAISCLLGYIAVCMGLCAGSVSSSGSPVEIFSILVMGCFMAECKECIIVCSKCRTPHPDHDRSVCDRRASIQGTQHIHRFIYPFHDRIPCFSLFLCSCRSRLTLRKSKPRIELEINKAVEPLHGITHPLRRYSVKDPHLPGIFFRNSPDPFTFLPVFLKIRLIAIHASDHNL